MKKPFLISVIILTLFCAGTNGQEEKACLNKTEKELLINRLNIATKNYKKIINSTQKNIQLPYTFEDGKIGSVKPAGWVSGFFPGTLWYLFEYTKDDYWKEKADYYSSLLNNQQFNTNTHDLGFMMYCSYGNGYRLTGNQEYKKILLKSSESLSTRFSNKVGTIRSWDFAGWWEEYPVIIDNMMNLEMLLWASKNGGEQRFSEIAKEHSQHTIKYHYRKNFSCFHVVDYDSISGVPLHKGTFQGASDESSWARGQAWGLYGFTMMSHETGETEFLKQAENIANYIISEIAQDPIPCWDFSLKTDKSEEKDASAGAIIASALVELYEQTGSPEYLENAKRIVFKLSEPEYFDSKGEIGGFLLKHSVANKPQDSGIDIPLNYADYYYVEAILKLLKIDDL